MSAGGSAGLFRIVAPWAGAIGIASAPVHAFERFVRGAGLPGTGPVRGAKELFDMAHIVYARTAAVLVLAVALFPAASSAAPATFADSICPEAAQYVIAAGNLTKSDPAQKVYDTAQAAVEAYARCSKDKLANGFREPQHYADTRSAQFAIMAARALMLLNRPEDARRELKQYRAVAQNVVDWQSETETPHSAFAPRTGGTEGGEVGRSSTREVNQNGHRPSLYQKSAKEIVAAADELLAQIDAQTPKSQPASAAAPGHETLHR